MSEFRRNLLKMGGRRMTLPEWFKEHIVCWYSPRRQGATNESLAADPRLRDLSGNGRHMTLTGFAWTEASGIDADGALVFGSSRQGDIAPNLALTDFTVIVDRNSPTTSAVWSYIFIKKPSSFANGTATICIPAPGASDDFYSFSATQTHHGYGQPLDGTEWMTATKYKGTGIAHGLYKGSLKDSADGVFAICPKTTMRLRSFLLFDVSLTEEQIQWTIDNLINK